MTLSMRVSWVNETGPAVHPHRASLPNQEVRREREKPHAPHANPHVHSKGTLAKTKDEEASLETPFPRAVNLDPNASSHVKPLHCYATSDRPFEQNHYTAQQQAIALSLCFSAHPFIPVPNFRSRECSHRHSRAKRKDVVQSWQLEQEHRYWTRWGLGRFKNGTPA